MRNSIILMGFWFSTISSVFGQSTIPDLTNKVLITAPESAQFTQYGKVPVGLFTGIPDIKVPIYDIKVDNYVMPIYLSYYARGVQPNTHSSWVCTGWSLFAGSAITRKINGLPDEALSPAFAYINRTAPLNALNISPGDKLGWVWHCRELANTDWTLPNDLGADAPIFPTPEGNKGATVQIDAGADEFDFNVNGISGAFFLGEDSAWHVRSGNGENIHITAQIKYGYDLQFKYDNSFDLTVPASAFYSFVLTTGDGTQYTFGNDISAIEFNRVGPLFTPDVNTVAMSWHLTQVKLPSGKIINLTYQRADGIQMTYNPSSHYESNTANAVGFNPSGFLSIVAPNPYSGKQDIFHPLDYNVNFVDAVYLQSITFPEGTLTFNSSLSPESDVLEGWYQYVVDLVQPLNSPGNDYPNPGGVSAYNIINSYAFQIISHNEQPSQNRFKPHWRQLNNIELDDYQKNKIKVFTFGYFGDPSTRQFLNSVTTTGYNAQGNTGQPTQLPPYTFSYNETPLPAYCTLQIDHWGYFNNNGGFPNLNMEDPNAYLLFRAPNLDYIEAGILTQINYPTGGFSQFTYQSNSYRKYVSSVAIVPAFTDLDNEVDGGGVRIQQIVSRPDLDPASPILTTNYYYVNNLNDMVCTGVLGMPQPNLATYYNTISQLNLYSAPQFSGVDYVDFSSYTFSSNMAFLSQNDDGNIVTYSEVIETQTATDPQTGNTINNGQKISTFTNHDNGNGDPNGYMNNPPDAFYWVTAGNQVQLAEYDDRSFERGLLLSESYYDNANPPNLIKQTINFYNSDPNRFNSYTKSILTAQTTVGTRFVNYALPRLTAVRNYTYYPFLQQTLEKDYPSDHSSGPLVTKTTYAYDNVHGTRNMIQKVMTTSDGQVLITNTRYPLDFTNLRGTDVFTLGIINLLSQNAVGKAVEQYVQRSNFDGTNLRTIGGTLNSYNPILPEADIQYKANMASPSTTFTPASSSDLGLLADPSYEQRAFVDNFDQVGNILQQHKLEDMNISYQWGYQQDKPVVKILNAANNYKEYKTSFYSISGGSFTFAPNDFTQQAQRFSVGTSGTITVSLSWSTNPGTNSSSNVSYLLSGPGVSRTGAIGTSNAPSPFSFTGMPSGNYTLYITPNINSSGANLIVTYTYPIVTQRVTSTSGATEFFYDGFEENSSPNVIAGHAHTGTNYWNAMYTTTFALPANTTRQFVIQWWSMSGTKWIFHEVPYSGITTLAGPVDDVRIFPTDAQMTSYTYLPLIGMTSMIDPAGHVTYYTYDWLGRLKSTIDQFGNVTKHYQYQYQQP